MGLCMVNKSGKNILDSKYNPNHNRKKSKNAIIKCTVDVGGDRIHQNFQSTTPISEVKRALKQKYLQLGHNSKDIDKKIIFYADGKPIKDENEQIGNINDGEDISFEIISVSETDNSSKDDLNSRVQEKVINKVSHQCKEHPGNKELLICITCGKAFCINCSDKHEGHKTLYKKELINSGKELKQKSNVISNALIECGFSDSRGGNNLCMEEKQRISTNIENLQKIVDEIKKSQRNLNNSFNKTFDDIYPFIMDYKEKIRKLNEKSLNIQTMKNSQDFLDYYHSYSEIKKKENKILDYITSLQRQIEIYKETIKEFNTGTNNIIEKIKEDYNILINLQFKEDLEQLGKSSFYRKTIDKSLGSVTTKHLGGGSGKMNLINMLMPKDKNRLIENEKLSYLNQKKNNKMIESQKLIEQQKMGGNEANNNYITGIEPNSKNIFIFDKISKRINKINLDFQGLVIDKFLHCFSTLNYNGRFYLSGGFNNPKAFFKLNYSTNKLIQLTDMPSGHNYHGMIGINNNIFSVSGFNNKNVEKYEIQSNRWIPLNPLEVSFSWPGLIFNENKFLYVFGGLSEIIDSPNKRIYKMDITSPNNIWEAIDINSNLPKIPFYSGYVQLSDKNILFLGGKFSPIENNMDRVFKYDFSSNNYEQDGEYKMPNREVFNGKKFCDLGGGLFGEFSCLSYNKFYLVDTSSRNIEVIE